MKGDHTSERGKRWKKTVASQVFDLQRRFQELSQRASKDIELRLSEVPRRKQALLRGGGQKKESKNGR